MAGQPTKLTAKRKRRILKALRAGTTRACAARYSGITYRSFAGWMARGAKEKRGVFFQFFQDVRIIEAELEMEMCGVIVDGSKDDPRWAAWWLERRRKTDYAQTTKNEVSGPEGKPLKIQIKPSNDKLTEIAEALADLGLIKP